MTKKKSVKQSDWLSGKISPKKLAELKAESKLDPFRAKWKELSEKIAIVGAALNKETDQEKKKILKKQLTELETERATNFKESLPLLKASGKSK